MTNEFRGRDRKDAHQTTRRGFVTSAAILPLTFQDAHAQAKMPDLNNLYPPLPGAENMKGDKVMVPMRDGIKLALDLYRPKGDGPWPVILIRTPYSRRQPYMYFPYKFLVDAGFVLAVQDCRGKFDSEGLYRPFIDDVEDGYDTIEWLAKQPFSTGNIGMTGASAMGITSYMAAMSGTPHLKAAAVTVARNPSSTQSRFPGGLYLENGAVGWSSVVGITPPQENVPHIAHLSESDIHLDLRRYDSKIDVPFIHCGGWYDIHQQPIIDNFTQFQKECSPPARGNQRLQMHAAAHTGPVKGASFPGETAAPWIPTETCIKWFDYWLKGEQNGILNEPPVRYYLMGDTSAPGAPGNEWRQADSWPPKAKETALYLREDGSLSDHPSRGKGKRTYVYDPQNAVPTIGGNNLFLDSGPLDQRPASHRPDVLRFTTEPLLSPTEVVGRVKLDLWVSTDAEDTDFIAKLVDIYPDGREALVHDEGFRLRHYKGLYSETRIEPGRVYPITIDLWSTALVFNKGHKIGIFIQSSNWPRFERHPNTWDPVPDYAHAVKATNSVHFGSTRPSRIILPVTRIY